MFWRNTIFYQTHILQPGYILQSPVEYAILLVITRDRAPQDN